MPTDPPENAPNRPMVPSDPLVRAANAALADPHFRESVRQMHAEKFPLVKMVDALGLEEDMSAQIRTILEGLPDQVVEGIRTATIDMLNGNTYVMPLNCTVTDEELDKGIPVDVKVEPQDGRPTIHVRPK